MAEENGKAWLDEAVRRWNESWECRKDPRRFPQGQYADEAEAVVTQWKADLDSALTGRAVAHLSREFIISSTEGGATKNFAHYGDEIHLVLEKEDELILTQMRTICRQAIPNHRPNESFPHVFWARHLWCADPESELNR